MFDGNKKRYLTWEEFVRGCMFSKGTVRNILLKSGVVGTYLMLIDLMHDDVTYPKGSMVHV